MPRLSSRIVSTERACETARPQGHRTEYRVAGFRGLVLRVSSSGVKSWSYLYRSPVTQGWRKMAIGNYPTIGLGRAKELATDCLIHVRSGKDPLARTVQTEMSFDTVVEEYQEAHSRRHSGVWRQEVARVLRVDILPHLKKHRCEGIKRNDVARVIERVASRGSYSAGNQALKIVRGVFRWGISTGRCEMDPTIGIRRYASKPRERTLTDAEIRALWHCTAQLRDAFRFALLTAARIGEVLNAHHSEIDNEHCVWIIPAHRTKSRREHKLPLSAMAVDIVRCRTGWLFPSEDGEPMLPRSAAHALRRLSKRLKLVQSFTPHDLRRTAATRMGDLGTADDVVERILNHTAATTARRHYNRAEKFEAMKVALQLWALDVEGLVRTDPIAAVTGQNYAEAQAI